MGIKSKQIEVTLSHFGQCPDGYRQTISIILNKNLKGEGRSNLCEGGKHVTWVGLSGKFIQYSTETYLTNDMTSSLVILHTLNNVP